jgi:hypothetical protein
LGAFVRTSGQFASLPPPFPPKSGPSPFGPFSAPGSLGEEAHGRLDAFFTMSAAVAAVKGLIEHCALYTFVTHYVLSGLPGAKQGGKIVEAEQAGIIQGRPPGLVPDR